MSYCRASVIVSTYNTPEALEKCLWGYKYQSTGGFEILVADDGSDGRTRALVNRLRRDMPHPLVHVWHEDRGFRKNAILNQAILRSTADYLIFTDGDCIPRSDFVSAHLRHSRPGWFLAGGSHIEIPEELQPLLQEDIVSAGKVFSLGWLRSQAAEVARYRFRLSRNAALAAALNLFTARSGVLVGCNSSAWKQDVLRVNGFDESLGYGGEDRDLGIRLTNSGVRSRRLKYSLVCVHLSHPRSYRQEAEIAANKAELKRRAQAKITWIESGIVRSPQPGFQVFGSGEDEAAA